jgi:hypothetical protein
MVLRARNSRWIVLLDVNSRGVQSVTRIELTRSNILG